MMKLNNNNDDDDGDDIFEIQPQKKVKQTLKTNNFSSLSGNILPNMFGYLNYKELCMLR